MLFRTLPVLMLAAGVAGCSGSGGVSTASILGGEAAPAPAAAAVPPASKPSERAFQAGAVTARAVKCGYNFDAAQLRASYIAYEMGRGATDAEVANLQRSFDVAQSGVTKAAADDPDYCSQRRTGEIKADLGRMLAGDFETARRAAVAQKQDDGFFSGWFDSGSSNSGPAFGSDGWWDKQREQAGQ